MSKRKPDGFDEDEKLKKLLDTYDIEKRKQKEFLSKRLEKLLREKGITQKDLHNITKVSEASISNYIKAERMPQLYILEKLAKPLGVTANYLIGKTGCKKPSNEEINNMMGISEDAMENLFCLKHDVPEFENLNKDIPISNAYEKQLATLSLLISDKMNLPSILTSVSQYIEKKQEILNLETSDKEDSIIREKVERLEMELLNIKTYIEHFLYKSLDNISKKI